MALGEATSPSPSPTVSNDPFNPDVTIWPEAPGWLFPSIMVVLVIVVAVVITLVVMWRKSVVYDKQERAAKGPTEWVDLSKLDRKGHWEDQEPTFDEPDADSTGKG